MPLKLLPIFIAVVLLATGCAGVQPVLDVHAKPAVGAGYLAGQFSRMKTRGYAFVIRLVDGGKDFTMALGEDSSLPTEVRDQTVAIALPPGTYSVVQWITYATLTKEVLSRRPVTNTVLLKPFTVKAGYVTHLGSHDVSESMQRTTNEYVWQFAITPRFLTEASVKESFDRSYPNLASLPFGCVLCVGAVQR